MDELFAETVARYDLEDQEFIGLRYTAAGCEIAAYLCRR